jgi:hypothetical protein
MDVSTAVPLDAEKAYEMVDGHPEERETAGARHGRVVVRLGAHFEMHSEQARPYCEDKEYYFVERSRHTPRVAPARTLRG